MAEEFSVNKIKVGEHLGITFHRITTKKNDYIFTNSKHLEHREHNWMTHDLLIATKDNNTLYKEFR